MKFGSPELCVDEEQKAYVDASFEYLLKQYGTGPIRDYGAVLATEEFFPVTLTGEDSDADLVLNALCKILALDPGDFRIIYIQSIAEITDTQAEGSEEGSDSNTVWTLTASVSTERDENGTYVIELPIESSLQRSGIQELIGFIVPQLVKIKLIPECGLPSVDQPQAEVASAFFGFGVPMIALSTIVDSNEAAETPNRSYAYPNALVHGKFFGYGVGWKRYTSLALADIAYAFALYLLVQSTDDQSWQAEIVQDGKVLVEETLEYLQSTNDLTPAILAALRSEG
jgi:hypothetical protein